MKIIFINTWDARAGAPFAEFLRSHEKETDVFCLSEVDERAKKVCEKELHRFSFAETHKAFHPMRRFNQSTYLAPQVRLLSSFPILAEHASMGLGLYTELSIGEKIFHVCNVHGMAKTDDDKLDDEHRLNASRQILAFMEEKRGPKIIGGDFNLLPQTQSIRMFEENGYRDLVREYDIPTTRNRLAWEKYATKQYFADYAFVSSDIDVRSFAVPQNEVSDHLPLILEIGASEAK